MVKPPVMPFISDYHSSLLSVPCCQELRSVKQNKYFVSSQTFLASSAHDFIDAKLNDVGINIEYAEKLQNSLKEVFKESFLTKSQFNEAV